MARTTHNQVPVPESGNEIATGPDRLPGEGYSEEEVARGLQALALHQGNTRRAARFLEKQGHPIPRSTLKSWLTTRAEDYERARVIVRDRVWEATAEQHQALVLKAIKASSAATEAAEAAVKDGDAKTANSYASASRNLATTVGISNDKASAAHGRPTEIAQPPNPDEILRKLAQLGLVVEVAPIDAEVVEEASDGDGLH
jgi:hypothetical protein